MAHIEEEMQGRYVEIEVHECFKEFFPGTEQLNADKLEEILQAMKSKISYLYAAVQMNPIQCLRFAYL
jgi:hypothetical protein